MGSETLRQAEARSQGPKPARVLLHLTPDGYSCREFNMSVAEAKHFRRRLSKAIRDAEAVNQ